MASLLALVAFFVGVFGSDLRTYWPGLTTHYLDGSTGFIWAALWFEQVDENTFRQYNSSPFSRLANCHFDELSWVDGFLHYERTVDGCGRTTAEVRYEPPIVLAPRFGNWEHSGDSRATYTVDGDARCEGVNHYTSTRFDMSLITVQEPRGKPEMFPAGAGRAR